MHSRLSRCPTRRALWSRSFNVLTLNLFALTLFALSGLAQIGGYGWTPQTLNFKIQSPYATNQSSRYFVTNAPQPTYHCLVYSNDSSFSVGNTTLPRTEQRFNPDYKSGEIQYQSYEMIPGNENSYCCFQIHTGDAESDALGSTVFMLFVFTNNNGSVREYSGTQLATNLAGKWFQLNVDHNLNTGIIKVWINTNLVWTTPDNGAGDFYFKDGVYMQSHNPTYQMDTYITNILIWTNPGTNPPVAPTGLTATPGGGQIALAWNAPMDATSYNVKRSTSSSGPFTTVGSTTSTNFADGSQTGGATYYYVVSAVDQFGEGSNSVSANAALTQIWNGGSGAGNNWNDANNWNGAALAANASPVFAGSARLINTNNTAAGTAYSNLVFLANGGPFSLNGNPIALTGDILNESGTVQTDNLAMTVAGNPNFNAGPAGLWLGGGITNTSSTLQTLHLQGTNGVLAGPLQSTVAPLNLAISMDDLAGAPGTWSLVGNNNSLLTNLTVAGNNSFTLGSGADSPSLIITNNTTGALTVGNVTNDTASFTMNSGRLALTNGNNATLDLGTTGGTGIFNLNGGTVNFAGKYLMIGDSASTGIFNQSGGTVTTAINNDIILGNTTSNSAGTVNLSGGTFNATANNTFFVGFRGIGVWNISGTGLLKVQTLNMTRNSSDSAGASGTVNLNGGTLIMNSESMGSSGANQTGAINFNGGVLQAAQSTGSFITAQPAETFTTTIQAGGAIINNAGFAITISSPLVSGGGIDGGLTSEGAGTLTLNTNNTYNGPTIVSSGTLTLGLQGSISNSTLINVAAGATFSAAFNGGPPFTLNSGQTLTGNGTLPGNTAVGNGATLAPGSPTGPLTFVILTLNGGSTTFMRLNKTAHTNSVVVVTSPLAYGGTLALTNLSGTLAAGDSFKLFSAAAYHGAFTSIIPSAPSANLLWNTNGLTNGILSVVPVPPPQFLSPTISGNSFAFNGSNGVPHQTYYVLCSTNLSLPTGSWTVIATNSFDDSGNFNFTNTPDPNAPPTFYLIKE